MIRIVVVAVCVFAQFARAQTKVTIERIPGGGVQPQALVDDRGTVHLIYLSGDPAHSDILYIRSTDDGKHWSAPIRVNDKTTSAIALGTVRGAHAALGRNGRVHIAWMGAAGEVSKPPVAPAPMLYTRIREDGGGFEPPRNLIVGHPGLDGGGSIAADNQGNVYVGWHAPQTIGAGEQSRRVWIARSSDDGKTFAPEIPVSDSATGACGCCGMRLAATDGRLFVLYRGASEMIHRGMYLLETSSSLAPVGGREIAPMNMGMCIMSTSALAPTSQQVFAAWETQGMVQWRSFEPGHIDRLAVPASSGNGPGRKHPTLATNGNGQVLLAWDQGTGWNKGGSVGWQLFKHAAEFVSDASGTATGLPAWDCPATFATSDGNFVVIY